jgi:hypothetical protein
LTLKDHMLSRQPNLYMSIWKRLRDVIGQDRYISDARGGNGGMRKWGMRDWGMRKCYNFINFMTRIKTYAMVYS